MRKLLILNYHELVDQPHSRNRWVLPKQRFIQQLELIKQLEIPIVSLRNHQDRFFTQFENLTHQTAVVITFDDSNKSDYEIAYPILKERAIPATFFPIISTIGENGYLNWEELIEMADSGFDIGSHTFSHPDLCTLSQRDLQFELDESKTIIEERILQSVQSLAVPIGKYNRKVERIAKELGYSHLLSTKGGTSLDTDFVLHRWNIKSSTSMAEFEKILKGIRHVYLKKKARSHFKQLLDRTSGNTFRSQNQMNP